MQAILLYNGLTYCLYTFGAPFTIGVREFNSLAGAFVLSICGPENRVPSPVPHQLALVWDVRRRHVMWSSYVV